MVQSRIKSAKRNLLGGFVNKVINLLLPFLTRTAIIYVLGSLYLGLNSLFSSILNVLSLAELGFGSAMVFSMYEPLASGKDDEVCAILKLYRDIYRIVGLVVLTIGLSLLFFLPKLIKGDVPNDINIYILYLIFLGNSVLSYFLYAYKSSLLIADQRSDINSNIQSVVTIASTIIQLLVLLTLKNYYIYCIIWPISTIIQNLVTNIVVNKRYPQFFCSGHLAKEQLMDIRQRVEGLFIYRLCYVFRDTFGSIIISAFLGLVVLAKYNNYFFIQSSVTGFLAIIKTSITAGIGNSIVTESQEKNYKDFNKFQVLYMWISIWCTATLFCLYRPFILLWIGEDYLFPTSLTALFCLLFFCYKVGDMCAVYRQAAGLWWQDRIRPIVEAVVSFVLSIVLVRQIGVAGVLLSIIVCLVFINSFWASRVLFKYYFTNYPQNGYILRVVFFLIVMIITTFVTYKLCEIIHVSTFWTIVVNFAICLFVPNLLIAGFFCMLPEFKDSLYFTRSLLQKQ